MNFMKLYRIKHIILLLFKHHNTETKPVMLQQLDQFQLVRDQAQIIFDVHSNFSNCIFYMY